jgi:DNA-binding FadR family transcriptional regulator
MRIDRASAVPLHLQIAAHLRDGILRGVYPSGTRFLGTREIARELGCSRTAVLTAWELLYAEGHLESMPRGGVTVVSATSAQACPAADVSCTRSRAEGVTARISKRWQSLRALEAGAVIGTSGEQTSLFLAPPLVVSNAEAMLLLDALDHGLDVADEHHADAM